MTTGSRFDRQLPEILEDLYVGPSPDYRDDVLAVATAGRQRPAWTFPGRWIPMADFAGRLSAPVRFPIRSLAVALVVVALIVAGALIYIGSRPRLPAPFGPAANGLVAYSQGSSLYGIDDATGASHVLIMGAAQNGFGWWAFSPDGTKLAYGREAIQGYDADGHAVQAVAACLGGERFLELADEVHGVLTRPAAAVPPEAPAGNWRDAPMHGRCCRGPR